MSLVSQVGLLVSGVGVARLLGAGDRGRLALIVLFATIVTQVGSLGMPLAVTYWIAKAPDSSARLIRSLRRFIVRQCAILTVVQGVCVLVVLRTAPGYEQAAAIISFGAVAALLGGQYGLGVLQGQRRFRAWNTTRLVYPIGYSLAIAALYLGHVDNLSVVVLCWVLATSAAALTAWLFGRKYSPAEPGDRSQPPSQSMMLRFGTKALLGSTSPLQSFNLDQAIVGLFISPAALGIYVVGVAFTNVPFFIAQSVGAVAYPTIAATSDRRHVRRTILASAAAVLVLAGLTVVLLELLLPWLVPFFYGHAFRASVGVARILLVYGLLVGLRRVLGDCARGAGRPGLSSIDELAALSSLLPMMLWLAPEGIHGVAWAMVIAAGVGLAVVTAGLGFTVFSPRKPARLAGDGSGTGEIDGPPAPAGAVSSASER